MIRQECSSNVLNICSVVIVDSMVKSCPLIIDRLIRVHSFTTIPILMNRSKHLDRLSDSRCVWDIGGLWARIRHHKLRRRPCQCARGSQSGSKSGKGGKGWQCRVRADEFVKSGYNNFVPRAFEALDLLYTRHKGGVTLTTTHLIHTDSRLQINLCTFSTALCDNGHSL
jgi:hypothetical protein